MEFIVKEQNKHIEHMHSNKLEDDVISKKSKAIHGLNRIADKFDDMNKVILRATAPKTLSSVKDEQIMIQYLRKIRWFKFTLGRSHQHTSMPKVPASMTSCLDPMKFISWFNEKKTPSQ